MPLSPMSSSYDPPDYDSVVSRSNSNATSSRASRTVYSRPPTEAPLSPRPLNVVPRRLTPRPLPTPGERYLYTYNLQAGKTPMHVLISVEPNSGQVSGGKFTFRLSFKANGAGRTIGEPVDMQLHVDPRELEFVVFLYPGKSSVPVGCLYCIRVWLRVNGIDHGLFANDELWIGRDLDFSSIQDVSFMNLRSSNSNSQVYLGAIGKTCVTLTSRWKHLGDNLYEYSLDYEAGGVGKNLFNGLQLYIDGDPGAASLVIYSVPMDSTPPGSSHRIRVWLRTHLDLAVNDPAIGPSQSYIYQRIWKMDSFKIGARLDFAAMSRKGATIGFASGGPQTIKTQSATSPRLGEKTHRSYH